MSGKPETHLMIDLEAAGSGPRAAILSIGIVEFAPMDPLWKDARALHLHVEFADAFKHGVADGDTFAWWLKQSEEARHALLSAERISLNMALRAVREFYASCAQDWKRGAMPVWGNGATFDITIMEAAFAACGLEVPWRFHAVRDCRTLKALAGPQLSMLVRHDVAHDALADAIYQAEWVTRAWSMIRHALTPLNRAGAA